VTTVQATTLTWYLDSRAISSFSRGHVGARSNTLTVLNASSEDQGLYQCVASSAYLSTYSEYAELTLS